MATPTEVSKKHLHLVPDEPDVLTELRTAGFQLRPNQKRPLTGRVVGEIFDVALGRLRPITDVEEVTRRYGEPFGGWFYQTWMFLVDAMSFQFNTAFQQLDNYGLQYRTVCPECGMADWYNINVPPHRPCRDCRRRHALPTTPVCHETLAEDGTPIRCSTAYLKRGCRCSACRAWNTAKHRRLREGRRCNYLLISAGTTRSTPAALPVSKTNKEVVTACESPYVPPIGWVWLPAALRCVLMQVEADFERWDEQISGYAEWRSDDQGESKAA